MSTKRHDGWYYELLADGQVGVFQKHEDEDYEPEAANDQVWIGPFDRFGMAKTDAIRLQEEKIEELKASIAGIRKEKEPGRKKRKEAGDEIE